jgi:Right handed beta helix region
MKSIYTTPVFAFLSLLAVVPVQAQFDDGERPLVLSDAVLPTPSKHILTDPRIFDPEFYRKFNPELGLSTDADAIKQWTNSGANHCLRGSFYFSAIDYLKRYADLGSLSAIPGACDSAVRHFVTYGFNRGRIGAFDSYPIVFDFNFYVDASNNPDLSELYNSGAWDQTDIQIHWLQHGIEERRKASAFFSIRDYQLLYHDVSELTPSQALFQYVTAGQAERRLGKMDWADPSEWSELVARSQDSVVTTAPNDLVREFRAANGKPTTVIVKSPKWFHSPSEPLPSGVHVCNVPPPNGNSDWNTVTSFLTPNGVKPGCDVVRLAANSEYHMVLPQNQPPATDYVLNHWPYLQINNVQDFVFDGNGSTLYFTGPTLGIDINNSQRVVIENLTLDWGGAVDPSPLWRGPLFAASGTIVPDGPNSAHIVLDAETRIPAGFSPYIYAFNLWDREKNEAAADDYLNTGPGDQGCDVYCIESHDQVNPSQQSMLLKGKSLYPSATPVGQWVASQLMPYPNRTVMVRFQQFAAMAITDDYGSSDIRIIHTTIHASPYMGITAGQGGRGLALEDVRETPSQGRPFSAIADGAHFTGVSGDIIVEGGEFEREGDDVMNITEVWDTLTAVNSADSFVMNGGDAIPNEGDTIAFFDEALGFLGSAEVESISPANLPPWGGQPITVQLKSPLSWLQPGVHAINMNHAPSRVYVSDVNIHDKLGRGILLGGFHILVRRSTFRNMTASAIASILSSYFGEGTGTSDVAIRGNRITGTNYVPKLFQSSSDGANTYPNRNASIAMFEDIFSSYNGVSNEVTGIYPLYRDIEISGNEIESRTGAGIFLTGTTNVKVDRDHFTGCGVVPNADPFYSYYGSGSTSAVVLSFTDTLLAQGNLTSTDPDCLARRDGSSSKDVVVDR